MQQGERRSVSAMSSRARWRAIRRAVADARAGRLPDHYQAAAWRAPFDARVTASLAPGAHVLDVGSGRTPTVPLAERPRDCRYVGLDLSASELELAPSGAYDELVVTDVARRVPALERSFDLIVSWQVLEHVKPLAAAIEHLRCYLRPGGRLVAFFSGTFSAYALLNTAIPNRLGVRVVARVMRRPPDTVFPAYYDRCYHWGLERMLESWSAAEVVPLWGGAAYFRFSRVLQSVYLAYEEWARLGGHRNLATHYLVAATC